LSWNLYSYVLGDPVNFRDRSGLQAGSISPICFEDPDACLGSDDGPPVDGGSSGPRTKCTAIESRRNGAPDGGCGGGNGGGAGTPKTPFPQLVGASLTAVNDAIAAAEKMAQGSPSCDGALSTYGIASISTLLSSLAASSSSTASENIFNGTTSSSTTPGGQPVAAVLSQGAAGALASLGTAADPGNMFLGAAFFSPGQAGVANSAYGVAQAFIIMHEAVHTIGNLGDAAFGGSKALTNLLVTNCDPIISSQLGNLTM